MPLIVGLVGFAVVTGSLLSAVLLLVAVEGVMLGVLPYLPSFQRYVQRRMIADARSAVVAERARLAPHMTANHRDELAVLESRVDAIRVRTGCGKDRDDWLGIEGLLTLFVRLAVAHNQSTRSLSQESAADLDRQLASVEVARRTACEAAWPRMDQHLEILERRRLLRKSAEERRSVVACDLAAIADLVRCLHDECVSLDGASASSEVADAIAEGLRSAAVLGDLAFLHSGDVPIDEPPATHQTFDAARGPGGPRLASQEVAIEVEMPGNRPSRRVAQPVG